MAEASVSHLPAPDSRTIGRLAAKLAITAGLVALGWLVGAVVSTSASAGELHEAGPAAEQATEAGRPASGLFRLLGSPATDTSESTDSTIASVNSTVTSVAKTTEDTVSTVSKTVDGTRSTVSAVTDSVTNTVTRTVDRTVGTVTPVTDTVDSVPDGLAPITGEPEQGTEAGEPEAAPAAAEPAAASAPEPAARPAKEKARQSKPAPAGPLNEPTPAAALDNAERPAISGTKASAATGSSGEREAPATPGFAVAQAASDTAAGKSHHATLADVTTETQLRLSGTSNCRSVFGAKSDPALPCTTPD